MKYDIFSFFYELDRLEMRLNILDPYVDYFVIVESTLTYSGLPKPLYYEENKERFKKWQHKIIHYVVDDFPNDLELLKMAMESPNTGNKEHWWIREFYQIESIKKALIGLKDEDICYLSDVDEIWNPELKFEIGNAVYKPRQTPYLYYLNNRTDENWLGWKGTIITKYKNIKNACLNHLFTDGMTEFVVLENGGWHFNALGGAEKKVSIAKHPEYTFIGLARKEINMRKDETGLPKYLLKNKKKWKQYFL